MPKKKITPLKNQKTPFSRESGKLYPSVSEFRGGKSSGRKRRDGSVNPESDSDYSDESDEIGNHVKKQESDETSNGRDCKFMMKDSIHDLLKGMFYGSVITIILVAICRFNFGISICHLLPYSDKQQCLQDIKRSFPAQDSKINGTFHLPMPKSQDSDISFELSDSDIFTNLESVKSTNDIFNLARDFNPDASDPEGLSFIDLGRLTATGQNTQSQSQTKNPASSVAVGSTSTSTGTQTSLQSDCPKDMTADDPDNKMFNSLNFKAQALDNNADSVSVTSATGSDSADPKVKRETMLIRYVRHGYSWQNYIKTQSFDKNHKKQSASKESTGTQTTVAQSSDSKSSVSESDATTSISVASDSESDSALSSSSNSESISSSQSSSSSSLLQQSQSQTEVQQIREDQIHSFLLQDHASADSSTVPQKGDGSFCGDLVCELMDEARLHRDGIKQAYEKRQVFDDIYLKPNSNAGKSGSASTDSLPDVIIISSYERTIQTSIFMQSKQLLKQIKSKMPQIPVIVLDEIRETAEKVRPSKTQLQYQYDHFEFINNWNCIEEKDPYDNDKQKNEWLSSSSSTGAKLPALQDWKNIGQDRGDIKDDRLCFQNYYEPVEHMRKRQRLFLRWLAKNSVEKKWKNVLMVGHEMYGMVLLGDSREETKPNTLGTIGEADDKLKKEFKNLEMKTFSLSFNSDAAMGNGSSNTGEVAVKK